jgi:hypothetical protein
MTMLGAVNCDTEACYQLWNDMNALGIGQSSMDFLSNIRWY